MDARYPLDGLLPLPSLLDVFVVVPTPRDNLFCYRSQVCLIISILDDLTTEERFAIADLGEDEVKTLELVMGRYMKFRLAELSGKGNDELLKECRDKFGDESMDDAGAASLILKEIWKQVRATHKIRVVK